MTHRVAVAPPATARPGSGTALPAAFRPDSRAAAIWRTFAEAWDERRAALTVAEARAAFASTGQAVPDSFVAEVSSLKRRGHLETVGRGVPLRYRPAGVSAAEAPVAEAVDDGEMVYAALVAACATAGHMVATRTVAREVARHAARLTSDDPNAVRSRLERMARPVTSARRAAWAPRTVRRERVPGLDGRHRTFWAPGDRPDLAPPAAGLVSQTDAAERVVRAAGAALRRPASTTELRLFGATLPTDDPARIILWPAGGRPHLSALVRETDRVSGPRVHVVRSAEGALGGAPARYWPARGADGAPAIIPEDGHLACLLDDACALHRPVEEMEGIVRVLRAAVGADARALEPLLRARAATLRVTMQIIQNRLGDTDGQHLASAVAASVRAEETVLRWIERRPAGGEFPRDQVRGRRRKIVATRRVPAVVPWLDERRGDLPNPRRLTLVPCTATLADLAPFADAYLDLETTPRALHRALEGCRRRPNPGLDRDERLGWFVGDADAARGAAGGRATALALLDRPEALAALARLQPDAWTRVTILRAYQLLGELARADDAVAESLARAMGNPEVSRPLRRQLLVAAGLLAAPVADAAAAELLACAAPGTDGARDAGAAVLALALRHGSAVVGVYDELLSEDGSGIAPPSPTARPLLIRARSRAARGLLLSVAAGR